MFGQQEGFASFWGPKQRYPIKNENTLQQILEQIMFPYVKIITLAKVQRQQNGKNRTDINSKKKTLKQLLSLVHIILNII